MDGIMRSVPPTYLNPYPTNVENELIIMPENSGLADGMFL